MMERLKSWLSPWGNWRNKRFWLLAALLAWTFLGFFGAPPLLERTLTQSVEKTGRTIEVADVYLNPFALSLGINGLEIRDPDGTPLVRFEAFYLNVQLSSIFRWAWTFRDIRLSGLRVVEERFETGETRLSRLAAALGEAPGEAEPPPGDRGLPRIVVHNLQLDDGGFEVTDNLAGGFHGEFGPVSLSARDIRTLPDHAGEKQVSIGTPGGGVISWRGDLQLVPLASEGKLNVTGKGLPAILSYADHFLPVELDGGDLEIDLDYSLEVLDGELRVKVDDWNARAGGISARFDGTDQPFLDLQQIALVGGSWSWPEKTASAESLAFDGMRVDAWLDQQGRLSLLDTLPPDDHAAPGEPAEGASGWQFSIGRVTVNDAAIDFQDRRLPTPAAARVENLALILSDVDNQAQTEIPAELTFELASGGALSYSGTVVALPELRLDGHSSVSNFGLPVLQPWLAQQARLELTSGTATLEADVSGEIPDSLEFKGRASVGGLELVDVRRDQRLAAFEGLDVERFELDLAGGMLQTSAIGLQGAYGRIHIYEDLSTNLDGLAVASEETTGETEETGLAVTIAGIEVDDAGLDFADDSLPLPFQAEIRSIEGSLSTLATTSSEPAALDLKGQVNEFGEARIEGTISPWDFTRNSDIDMTFRNLQMSALTPYTIQYAGYAIKAGRLDMELGYTLEQRRLEGENNIVIRELVLGDQVEHPDAASLPLKLAVALLKDSEGVIDVDLPVSGDLDDPSFRISGIIWKAIGNLITRVVTSPFRFLGGLVGVDSEDFGTLRFRPGRAEVSPPDREQLIKLAGALSQRPELGLVVTGVYVEEIDRPALKEQAFEARFEAVKAALVESGEEELIEAQRVALESLFAEAFPGVPLESVRAEHMRPSPDTGGDPGSSDETVLDETAYLNALRQRLIEAEGFVEAQLRELGAARAQAVDKTLRASSTEQPLAVSVSERVESGEAEEGSVLMELEVSVREDGQAPDQAAAAAFGQMSTGPSPGR